MIRADLRAVCARASLAPLLALLSIVAVVCGFAGPRSGARAAEATTGSLGGTVTDAAGTPLAGVRIAAVSASGRYAAESDERGTFSLLGMTPDTYVVTAERAGFAPYAQSGVTVVAGTRQRITFSLASALRTIGRVSASSKAFVSGATSDTFVVAGRGAQARSPVQNASGLATFSAGSVQGALAGVPGVGFDGYANAILRGGKVQDAAYDYDSVPVPQGLVANPGGNLVGAQLPTTGVGETNVTLAGYGSQAENALGGVVDEIPLVGTYPARGEAELGIGAATLFNASSVQYQTATSDLRTRLALSARSTSEYFAYGDGHTFYPSEASTDGIAIQKRGQFSVATNLHVAVSKKNDLAFTGLAGQASYDQYATPFSGLVQGSFDCVPPLCNPAVRFPGETSPRAPVMTPTRTRGTFDVLKAQWTHTGSYSLERLQLYQSHFSAVANGPYWDDNGFGGGVVSLVSRNGGFLTGATFDGSFERGRHDLRYGVERRVDASILEQLVPTAQQTVLSRPTLQTTLGYLGDTYRASERLSLGATARVLQTHVIPRAGGSYDVAAVDPHVTLAYRLGNAYAIRASFDHTTVAPKALEADRFDSKSGTTDPKTGAFVPAPFVPLQAEKGSDFTYSFEGGGRTQFRLTYFQKFEKNRIDVLPPNFRSAVAAGLVLSGEGVPTNVGELRANGAEAYVRSGGFVLNANAVHAFSSSATQFAYNGLNAAAIVAGHRFPESYIPDLTASLAYEFRAARNRLRITPALSFESGYPYGNGRKIWVFAPDAKTPILVQNDNDRNPGFNYYFLRDPAKPFDARSNPYVATLGTPEGDDPNTLRTPPQTLLGLHLEADVAKRMTATLDVTNALGNFAPTRVQGNPYLIGPPGYAGGNPLYAAAYGAAAGLPTYALGNGVPTNDGVRPIVPWRLGTAGYIPESYSATRTLQVRVRYAL